MDRSQADALQHRVVGACMILAPLLLLLSTAVYWLVSEEQGRVIQVYAFFLFIPASLGLTHLLWERVPRLAVALRLLLIFGCGGGIGYGVAYAMHAAAEDAGVGEAAVDELTTIVDTGLPLILNVPGVIFPLSIVVTGITLWRTRAVPPLAAILLAAAGVLFPVSRIGEIQMLQYVVDGLFVVALGWIGLRFLESTANSAGAQVIAETARSAPEPAP